MPTYDLANGANRANGVSDNFRAGVVDHNGDPWRGPNPDAPDRDFGLPNVFQFGSMLGSAFKSYIYDRHDESLRRSREEANSMRRDAFLMGLIQERALGVASLRWHIEVDNDRDPQQKAVKDGLTSVIKSTPHLQQLFYYTEDETIWTGRGGAQFAWQWQQKLLPPVPVKSFSTGMGGNGQPPMSPSGAGQPSTKQPKGLYGAAEFGQQGESNKPPTPGPGGNPFGAANGQQPSNMQMGMNPARSAPERMRALCVRRHQPFSGDSLTHEWDGTPLMLINQAHANERDIPGARIVQTSLGRAMALQGTWRTRFLLDSHTPMPAEFFDYERQEAIHGVGIRSVIYWNWWLREEWLSNVADWCERTGLGVRLWYYQGGNPESKKQVAKAAKDQDSKVNLLIPRFGDKAVEGVDVVDTSTGGADLLHRLMLYVDAVIERYIVGQSMSSGADSEGSLGGTGRAKFAESTKNKILAFDANNRADTITSDWLALVQKHTYPDFADLPARFVFDVDEQDQKDFLESVKTFVDLGGDVREDDVRGKLALREPMEGDKILKSQPKDGGLRGMPGMPGEPDQSNEDDGTKPPKPETPQPTAIAKPKPEDSAQYQRAQADGWSDLPDDLFHAEHWLQPRQPEPHSDESRRRELDAVRQYARDLVEVSQQRPAEPAAPPTVNVTVEAETRRFAAQAEKDAELTKAESGRALEAAQQAATAASQAEQSKYAAEEMASEKERALTDLAAEVRADVERAREEAEAAGEARKSADAALAQASKAVGDVAKLAEQMAKDSQGLMAQFAAKADEVVAANNRPRTRTARKNPDGSVTITED